MEDYKAVYEKLFKAQTEAINALRKIQVSLIRSQQEVEAQLSGEDDKQLGS